MKCAIVFAAMLFVAVAAVADDYTDGVAAVQAKDYAGAIVAFRKAITQAPQETPTYLPHYWIGVAKFGKGDYDGALQHWRLSEAQGKIKQTAYYAQMQDYVARAQGEKQKLATSDPKKAAENAIQRAIAKQGDAVSHGRDRTHGYRNGQARLQQATAAFRNGNYANAQRQADEASDAFDGKVSVLFPAEKEKEKEKETPPVISRERADAEIAEREEKRRRAMETKTVVTETTATVAPPPPPPAKPNLEPAYRAYATGNLGASEAQLTKIIAATPTAEAFLLRGCARFTKATLTRASTDAAAADFRAALQRDTELRLDPAAFSPKLVKFFEDIREGRRSSSGR